MSDRTAPDELPDTEPPRRLSQKVRGVRDRLLPTAVDPVGTAKRSHLPEARLEASPVPQILVDPSGAVASINERARSLFGLPLSDVGRPLRDLQLSYRPADLIDQATAERRPIAISEVEWRAPSGESRWLEVQVAPLGDRAGNDLGILISYTDVTGQRRLTRELEQSHQEMETAHEELQSTKRGEELNEANAFVQSVMSSLRAASRWSTGNCGSWRGAARRRGSGDCGSRRSPGGTCSTWTSASRSIVSAWPSTPACRESPRANRRWWRR
jgi:PAS domain S-box-containing protein